jgi:hypothetical protein
MDAGGHPATKVLSSTTGGKTILRHRLTDGPLVPLAECVLRQVEVAAWNPIDPGTNKGGATLFLSSILSRLRSAIIPLILVKGI